MIYLTLAQDSQTLLASHPGLAGKPLDEVTPFLRNLSVEWGTITIAACAYDAPLIYQICRDFGATTVLLKVVQHLPVDPAERFAILQYQSPKTVTLKMTTADVSVYQVYLDLQAGRPVPDGVLRTHPVWPILSFLCNDAAITRFLTRVGDWRWFMHPWQPGRRWSRLFRYLKLSRNMIHAHLLQPKLDMACRAAIGLWRGPDVRPEYANAEHCLFLRPMEARDRGDHARWMAWVTKKWVGSAMLFWQHITADHPEFVFDPSRVFTAQGQAALMAHFESHGLRSSPG